MFFFVEQPKIDNKKMATKEVCKIFVLKLIVFIKNKTNFDVKYCSKEI